MTKYQSIELAKRQLYNNLIDLQSLGLDLDHLLIIMDSVKAMLLEDYMRLIGEKELARAREIPSAPDDQPAAGSDSDIVS